MGRPFAEVPNLRRRCSTTILVTALYGCLPPSRMSQSSGPAPMGAFDFLNNITMRLRCPMYCPCSHSLLHFSFEGQPPACPRSRPTHCLRAVVSGF